MSVNLIGQEAKAKKLCLCVTKLPIRVIRLHDVRPLMDYCHNIDIGGVWFHFDSNMKILINYIFIALIHPIQWTIALPVGATGPAKRQKKTSCIYYRQDRSQSVHSPGGASYFISCLPLDVIASFSFGAKECAEDFLQRYAFEFLQRTLPSFLFFISTE